MPEFSMEPPPIQQHAPDIMPQTSCLAYRAWDVRAWISAPGNRGVPSRLCGARFWW
jgi:hypothetical protein